MSKLFFGIVPKGTICDVFINTLVNWSNDWLPACTADITPTGHLIFSRHEQYVMDLSQNNPLSFRDIDYKNRLDDIEKVLDKADGKKVWIGNFHNNQAQIIKNHFGNEVTTVGITYTTQYRHLVLENVLSYYNLSKITDKQKYKIALGVKYYSDKQKWDREVPNSFTNLDTDISIDVADFFDPDNYIKKIEDIDGQRNEKQLDYYFTWLYKTKERINENI